MTTRDGAKKCEVSVNRGGNRWPRFYPCGRPVEEGHEICSMHGKAEARRKAKNEYDEAQRARGNELQAEAEALSERLGVKVQADYRVFGKGGYTGNFVLPGDYVRQLAERS